jgi:hypothetical protein
MEWNLADEINTNWSSGSLFDDLPSKAKALRTDEVLQSTDKGREFNTSAEGSFVPGSTIAPIETPKLKAEADSVLLESNVRNLSENPLNNFQAPAAKAEVEEPQTYSTGQAISEGYRMISDIKRMQAGRVGRNAREVAREKALDNQAIGAVYSAMQQHLESKGYDPRLVDMLGTKQGGGFRTAEDIDRLFEIKSKGTKFQDENGEVIVAPDSDWDLVFEADRASRAMLLKSQKTATGGGAEEISRWQNVLKNTLDTDGNVMPNRIGEYEKATSELDRLSGAPTGTTRYFQDTGRVLSENTKLSRALANNVSYKGIQKEQLQNKINENIESLIQLAIDRGAAPSQTELKDYLKTGAPFLMNVSGQERVVFPTDKPDVYKLWDPTVKKFGTFDLNPPVKKQDEPEQSEFSDAGQVGQKIRKAGGGVVRAVKGASTTVGEKISNIPAGVANAGVSIVEAGAGVFNVPLKLPRVSNISESLQKMGLKKYEDGTWGPSN